MCRNSSVMWSLVSPAVEGGMKPPGDSRRVVDAGLLFGSN
jgi:hypothetical protein